MYYATLKKETKQTPKSLLLLKGNKPRHGGLYVSLSHGQTPGPHLLCSLMYFLLQNYLHFVPFFLTPVPGALDQSKFPDSGSCIFLLL